MKPLRVLTVVSNFGRHGAQTTLARFLEAMDRTRLEVELCTTDGPGPEAPRFTALGLPVHVLRRRTKVDPVVFARLVDLMRRGRYDLVYTYKHSSAFLARPAAVLAGIPLLVHEQGSPLQFVPPWVLHLDRWQSRGTHLVAANSQATARICREVLGIRAERLRVLHNPAPRAALPPLRSRTQDASVGPLLGYFGRLTPTKGVDLLIRALPALLGSLEGTRLHITGEGPARAVLEALVRELRVESAVRFSPWQPDPLASMQAVDLIVVPSLYEAYGNVVLEAALAQTPVVAAAVGGIPEILDAVGHGVALEPTVALDAPPPDWAPLGSRDPALRGKGLKSLDPADLARTLEALWRDPSRREALSRGSAERATRAFSPEAFARDLTAIMFEASELS